MNFRTQLLQIGAVGLVGALAIGFTSWYAQVTYSEALEASERNAIALRNHMEGDMMHDALRADVLRALWVAAEKNTLDIEEVKNDVNEHGKNFRDQVQQNKQLKLGADARKALEEVEGPLTQYIGAAEDSVELAFKDLDLARVKQEDFNKKFSDLEEKMATASDKLEASSAAEAAATHEQVKVAKWIQALTILISGIASIVLAFKVSTSLMGQLGGEPVDAVAAAKRIGSGDYDPTSVLSRAERSSLLGQMETMREQLSQGAAIAIENARVRQALDATSSNVMLADVNRNIVYANNSIMSMLRDAEADLRKELPQFSTEKVVGSNMDIFHKNPAHQSSLLANLRETYVGNISISGRIFRLVANPIFSPSGERLGSVLEWLDRTKEVLAENETNKILSALDASTSNLMLVDEKQKIAYLNNTIKQFMQNAEKEFKQKIQQFSPEKLLQSSFDIFNNAFDDGRINVQNLSGTQVADTSLGGRILRLTANPIRAKNGDYLGTVVEWIDRTQEVAAEKDVSGLVEKAAVGDFSTRINLAGKDGFFLKIAEELNKLVANADQGLSDIARVIRAIATGDLTEKIYSDYNGTFGELKNYCNDTTSNLTDVIGEIRAAAETIFNASSEIASGNSDLSSRTEQQAANLEETASSMEQITSTVKLNADNAKQANVLAEKASSVAIEGGALIQQVVSTMSAINESSQKIADIIGVIDGIAFQTNILALNAAVEAARAGDQGRGFAVVAAEVRTLAQRSANAAKDIKGLISDSVKKIDSGNTLVNKSGDTMKEIVIAIKRVNDIMAEIAAASAEQSTGIEEVSGAVSQMDEMTQQNAALVEEAAAAAESLQSQADQLTQRVAMFRLANEAKRDESPKAAARLNAPSVASKSSAAAKRISAPKNQDDEWESF